MTQNSIIAITGLIGSGKSEVLNAFKELGYKTISMDDVYTNLLKTNLKLKKEIKNMFGSDIEDYNGNIDKKKLLKKLNTKDDFEKLENITHIYIIKKVLGDIKVENEVVLEIPLLFKKYYFLKKYFHFKKIIIVESDYRKIVERVKSRNISKKELSFFFNIQKKYYTDDFYKKAIILYNNGTKEEIKHQIYKMFGNEENIL